MPTADANAQLSGFIAQFPNGNLIVAVFHAVNMELSICIGVLTRGGKTTGRRQIDAGTRYRLAGSLITDGARDLHRRAYGSLGLGRVRGQEEGRQQNERKGAADDCRAAKSARLARVNQKGTR